MSTTYTTPRTLTRTGWRVTSIAVDLIGQYVRAVAYEVDSSGAMVLNTPITFEAAESGATAVRDGQSFTRLASTYTAIVEGGAPNGFRRRLVNHLRMTLGDVGTEA